MSAEGRSSEVSRVVEHLFRREFGRLVAMLTRHAGVAYLRVAEDVVQDALVQAMVTWPFTGVPDNPSAWLLQTARRRALDHARRRTRWHSTQRELTTFVQEGLAAALAAPPDRFEDEIRDSELRMMFVCCHPALGPESQVALTLKTLCGFGEAEIAAAFLVTEAAVTKRLVRARRCLRERGVTIELPPSEALAARVATVLHALYLLFNEGYKASRGDALLRADLCAEAMRLTEALAAHPIGDTPTTHALMALMCFHAARLPARVGGDGGLLVLAEQDRRLWDRDEIHRGLAHLARSAAGPAVTRLHVEAGIAACHALAADAASTDWPRVLALYDLLLAMEGSPVVALNRAVAVSRVHGPHAGLRALREIEGRDALDGYHLLHAVTGQLQLDAGDPTRARESFRRALALAALPVERALIEARLTLCDAAAKAPPRTTP